MHRLDLDSLILENEEVNKKQEVHEQAHNYVSSGLNHRTRMTPKLRRIKFIKRHCYRYLLFSVKPNPRSNLSPLSFPCCFAEHPFSTKKEKQQEKPNVIS